MCRGEFQVLRGFKGDEELDGDASLEDALRSVLPRYFRQSLNETGPKLRITFCFLHKKKGRNNKRFLLSHALGE